MLYKEIANPFIEKNSSNGENVLTHFITTSAPDRDGEIINPHGCDFGDYRKNPVVFFSHRSHEMPIAKNISLEVRENGIIARTKFDDSEFAREIYRLNTEGFLNSWSIGFVPLEEPKKEKGVRVYNKWKLIEYSSVPVPANPEAVNLMLKEIKNDKLREIIEEQKRDSTLTKLIKQIVEDKLKKITNANDELVKREIKLFENKLVRKLKLLLNL